MEAIKYSVVPQYCTIYRYLTSNHFHANAKWEMVAHRTIDNPSQNYTYSPLACFIQLVPRHFLNASIRIIKWGVAYVVGFQLTPCFSSVTLLCPNKSCYFSFVTRSCVSISYKITPHVIS